MCIVTKRPFGRSGVRIPLWASVLALLQNVQTSSGAPPRLLLNVLGFVPGIEWPGPEVSHLHLVPTFRMSGDKRVLPLYVFMAWIATTFWRAVTKRPYVQGIGKCGVKCIEVKWSEVIINGENCVLSLIYSCAAVCRFCAVRCVNNCLRFVYSNYSTYVF